MNAPHQSRHESNAAAPVRVARLVPALRSADNSEQSGAVTLGGPDVRRPAAIRVDVPIRTVSEMNGREHWTVKAKRVKLHRQAAWLCLAGKLSFLPCTVILTRIAPRTLDGDNLQASLKACRDGVADWLGVDDGDSRVIWRYAQRPGAPKQYAVEVAVEHDD